MLSTMSGPLQSMSRKRPVAVRVRSAGPLTPRRNVCAKARSLVVSAAATTGIDIHPGGSNVLIADSKVRNNGKGIEAYSTTGTTVRNTEISGNATTGFQIGWSSGWAITGSKILRNGGNGVLTDTSGDGSVAGNEIRLNGEAITRLKPYQINRRGLSRSFQISNLFVNLSVYENLRCAVLWSLGYKYSFWHRLGALRDAQ